LLSDGTWDYVYTGGATPTEQIATSGSSPTTDLLLSDESGNVRGLVQLSSGTHQDQLVNYTDYAAYGNPITQSGGAVEAGGLTTPQTALNSNYVGSTPMGFGEGYTDATGLIYLIGRYYDPCVSHSCREAMRREALRANRCRVDCCSSYHPSSANLLPASAGRGSPMSLGRSCAERRCCARP
jgi:hypothetical protein